MRRKAILVSVSSVVVLILVVGALSTWLATYKNNEYFIFHKEPIYNASQRLVILAWQKYGRIFSQPTGIDREADELLRQAQDTLKPFFDAERPITSVDDFNDAFFRKRGRKISMKLKPLIAANWKCIVRDNSCYVPMNFSWTDNHIPPVIIKIISTDLRDGRFPSGDMIYDGDILEISGKIVDFFYQDFRGTSTLYLSRIKNMDLNIITIDATGPDDWVRVVDKQEATWSKLDVWNLPLLRMLERYYVD